PFAEDRFLAETQRLYGVLNQRLEGRDYIVDEYSIADMACWPWVSRYEWQRVNLADFPNVLTWFRRVKERPAVQAGYHVPKWVNEIPDG
ncbi:MAG: glutathione S-transferase family protein, partial [Rhizobiaceae bacterium]|nr:glutathione S-transferase family protein [Rhizobiaceae bacterium]